MVILGLVLQKAGWPAVLLICTCVTGWLAPFLGMPFSLCHGAGLANWKRLARVVGLVLGVLLVVGFRLQAGTSPYLVDVWDREDGLPSSSVSGIAQTPEGYLWIGTFNGLERFDGARFVNFDPFNTPELKQERVHYLFTDAQGTLWINTFDGSMTTWRKGVFTRETNWPGGPGELVSASFNRVIFATTGAVVERLGPPDKPSRWQVIRPAGGILTHTACADAAGDIWYITANHQLGRVQGNQSEILPADPVLPGNRINCLATDPAGRLWVGTDAGLARREGSHFLDQTPADPEPLSVTFLAINPQNECWVFANGHMRRCRDRVWVAEATAWRDLPRAHVNSLSAHMDLAGNLWFVHFGKGLLCAGTDGSVRSIASGDGLPGNRVICWFQDREGNVWVGADRGGLARLRPCQFKVINSVNDPAANTFMSVCEDAGGAVWMGSLGGGITRWQNEVVTNFPLTTLNNQGSVFAIYPDQQPGCLWLSADSEDLYRFANGQISQPNWSVHGVKAILRDRRGRLWLGMRDGLACYANGTLKHLGTNDGFQRSDVRALAEDGQGNIWAGTGTGELYRFGNQNIKPGAVAGGVVYRVPDRWGKQPVWAICPDQGTLWVGTFRGGLLRFQDGQFTRYTVEQGLPNDVICQILPDRLGNLWLGTYGGIVRVSKAELNAAARAPSNSIAWATYGRLDGLTSLECAGGYQPSGWLGADGRLWFSTSEGVASIQPNTLISNRQVPPLLIEDVIVDGKPVNLPPATASSPASFGRTDLEIGPGKHYVEFHYTGLSFTAPEQVRFRYRLRGLEDQWVEAGTRRFAPYTFLHPGDYHFEVMACNNEGLWNPHAAALTLSIQPHVWESWWFFLSLGCLLAGSIAIGARRLGIRKYRRQMERLEQQQALERDRARIARDIHDDLGSGLTQIGLLTELTRRAPAEALDGRLNQISDTARELTGAMDEIVWAVNPRNDTLDSLAIYLCKFVPEFLSLAGVRCRLDVPVRLPPRPLSAESRHNLFLAVKEALNNAVKYAQATEVRLKLIPARRTFTILIQDNGRGFAPNADTIAAGGRSAGGNGLPNLAQRLKNIGGRVRINSQPGRGVTVGLTVPFDPPASPQMAISIRQSIVPFSPPAGRN
jgi:signal transduction histidine kinase/ligand-binding sensor domain-containing protein